MSTHRTLDGQWTTCHDNVCQLKFHFSDMTVEQMQRLPMPALLPLLEAFDPPQRVLPDGEKVWLDLDKHDLPRYRDIVHRDYDLPAIIYPDGTQQWLQNNEMHREGGRPAVVYPDGRAEWWLKHVRYDERGVQMPYRIPRFPRGLS
jgi:hypothetical protein